MTDHSESAPEIYDRTTVTLHWVTAILVAIEFLIGRMTSLLPRGPLRVDIWSAGPSSNVSMDGLEQGVSVFNRLEDDVCTMCALGDQRKSRNNQRGS
jgi:hypothetical protein